MLTNLKKINIPKNSKNIIQQNKQSCEKVAQKIKRETTKFLQTNSKCSSGNSNDNIENEKNITNIMKNDSSKKPIKKLTLQQVNKVSNQKIPINLKISYKKINTKLSSNSSRNDVDLKNLTNDSINTSDDINSTNRKKKIEVKTYYTHRNQNESKNVNTMDTNLSIVSADEKKNSQKTKNENFQTEKNLDINEFITNKNNRIDDSKSINKNNKVSLNNSKKEEEIINNTTNQIETHNEQNLKLNLLININEFTSDEYRNLVTQLLKRDYSNLIIDNLLNDEEILEDCLINHKITERMRMRMVDWMIEVMSNYKCDEHSFFLAVNLMDRYFKHEKNQLIPSTLHSIGMAAMFLASKFYDVSPLRLKIVYEKIGHKKVSCEEIRNQEKSIADALNYMICKPTVWEFLNLYIEELFYNDENNYNINNKLLIGIMQHKQNNLDEKQKTNNDFPTQLYTEKMIKLLKLVVVYISKMNTHDYSLISKKPSLVASSTLFVSLKICEQINKETYVKDYFFRKITEISRKTQSEIIKCAQKILSNAQNFDVIFPGLDNLKRIHFNSIIEIQETK